MDAVEQVRKRTGLFERFDGHVVSLGRDKRIADVYKRPDLLFVVLDLIGRDRRLFKQLRRPLKLLRFNIRRRHCQ